MKLVVVHNRIRMLPAEWNELSKKDLLFISALSRLMLKPEEFKTRLALYFLKLRFYGSKTKIINGRTAYRMVHKYRVVWVDSLHIAYVIDKCLAWIIKEIKDQDGNVKRIEVDSHLEKQILPVIKVNGRKYYGPDNAMSNSTLDEFISAMVYFNHWQSTGNIKHLNSLIACLYRPASKNKTPGDIRRPFDDNLTDLYSSKLSTLHPNYKKAIEYYFIGTYGRLQKLFPYVFPENKYETQGKSDLFFDFMDMVNILSKNDVTKNRNVRQELLYEVLHTFNNIIKKSKDV